VELSRVPGIGPTLLTQEQIFRCQRQTAASDISEETQTITDDRAQVLNELGKPAENAKHLCNRLTANSPISRADQIIASDTALVMYRANRTSGKSGLSLCPLYRLPVIRICVRAERDNLRDLDVWTESRLPALEDPARITSQFFPQLV
jgi:hypothetical protein